MTHFVALVIGDNIEAQLQRYHQFECTGINDRYVIDVDKTAEVRAEYEQHHRDDPDYPTFRAFLDGWYGADKVVGPEQEPDRDGEHKFGFVRVDASGNAIQYVDRTNPNRKWDYWRVGGRWGDFFLLKKGADGVRVGASWERTFDAEDRARLALMQREEREMEQIHADAAKKGDIDWEGLAAERMRDAGHSYDEFLAKAAERGGPAHEAYFFDVQMKPAVKACLDALDREQAREEYQKLTIDDFESRDEYLQRKARRAGITRVVVKDGVWMERGEAGWFGMFNDAMSEEEWDRRYWELLESLPDDTLLTIVDCHI